MGDVGFPSLIIDDSLSKNRNSFLNFTSRHFLKMRGQKEAAAASHLSQPQFCRGDRCSTAMADRPVWSDGPQKGPPHGQSWDCVV